MRIGRLGALAVALLAAAPALHAGQDVLLEGFEQPGSYKAVPTAQTVKGADAVTQGSLALQLPPSAQVSIVIPAKAAPKAGWIRVDTSVAQPAPAAAVDIFLQGFPSCHGYVAAGQDVLAIPLLTRQGDNWPDQPLTLTIRNASDSPLVIDNIRLSPPADAPAGAVLLDFGPEQEPWPGFLPAVAPDPNFAWNGNANIDTFQLPGLDPLLGGAAGAPRGPHSQETLTLKADHPMTGCIYLTHLGHSNSAPLEYSAKIGNTVLLAQKLTPAQVLSPAGIMLGKDAPWTTDWLEKQWVPQMVSRHELQLPAGGAKLDLLNCQVSALLLAPANQQAAMKTYLANLEDDLKRYRRQFVLGAQHRPRCGVSPTEAETRAGLILLAPPPDQWFSRTYAGDMADRAASLKLTLPAGGATLLALAAVPLADAPGLQVALENLSDGAGSALPPAINKAFLLESAPAVRQGCVYWQSFLPEKSLKNLPARGVAWLVVQLAAPEKAAPGAYRGNLRLTVGTASASLPVEVEVFRMAAPQPQEHTLGALSSFDLDELYRTSRNLLQPSQQASVSRDIMTHLQNYGFNANLLPGPFLAGDTAAESAALTVALKDRLRLAPGLPLIDLRYAVHLGHLRNLQPGTSRFDSAFTNLAKAAADVLGKAGIANAPLFYGHVGEGELREALACCDAVKAGGAKSAACVLPGPPQSSTQRDELLKRLDVLLIEPHPGSQALVDEFKKTPGRPVMLLAQPSVFGTGFCAYGLGAEGVYVRPIFQDLPMFNAFWFDGRSLLLPDTPDNGLLPPFKQSLQPTLTLLQVQQGSQDLHLAIWCEALAKAAKAKGLDASEMDKLLADIRAACAARPDNFEPDGLRSAAVTNKQTCDWRTGLTAQAAKLSAALTAK